MTLCFYIKPYEMYAGLTGDNIGLGETCSQILIRKARQPLFGHEKHIIIGSEFARGTLTAATKGLRALFRVLLSFMTIHLIVEYPSPFMSLLGDQTGTISAVP